jgi:hypothetical protein
MKWFWLTALVIATWQIEMAVQAGIAASRRPKRPSSSASTPVHPCPGDRCNTNPQSQPTIRR